MSLMPNWNAYLILIVVHLLVFYIEFYTKYKVQPHKSGMMAKNLHLYNHFIL